MDNLLEVLKSRRSTRKFLPKAVPSTLRDQVVEAGRFAPSGMNLQQTRFLVIENRDVMDILAELVRQGFQKAGVSRPEDYVFHYSPPVFIVVCNRVDNPNNQADCSCALENMMLMASFLELGSCWINQLKTLNDDTEILHYLETLGMDPAEKPYGALALGYPDTQNGLPLHESKPRTGNPVVYIP